MLILLDQKLKARIFGFLAMLAIRCVGFTLRITVEDRSGVSGGNLDHPIIWAFWHNRMFVMPIIYLRHLKHRRGAVLTSASRDGEVIAETMRRFGIDAVRGSSSRRGVAALIGLKEWLDNGFDVVVTPDGPRGPRYDLQPGLIKLADKTGAPVLPVLVEYQNAWVLNTWDRFSIPKPFSRVTVVLQDLQKIAVNDTEESYRAERSRLAVLMTPPDEDVCQEG